MNTLTVTQAAIKAKAQQFAEHVIRPQNKTLTDAPFAPYEWFRQCGQLGLIGTCFPEKYGGLGLGLRESVIVLEEIARESCSFAVSLLAQMHCSYALSKTGTEEQKNKYLIPALRGEQVLAVALTEESADSNLVGMSTTASKDGDCWVINGAKRWTSNAGNAHTYVIAAHTEGEKSRRGIALFIVDADTPGLQVEPIQHKMGLDHASHGNIILENCRVPDANRIPSTGEGFSLSQIGMNFARTHCAAALVGVAQGALDRALEYTKTRKILGRSITSYQSISFSLVEMETWMQAMRSMLYNVACTADTERLTRQDAAMLKYFTSEYSCKVCQQALRLFGANGYNSDYDIERYVRDSCMLQSATGTIEMCKITISNEMLY